MKQLAYTLAILFFGPPICEFSYSWWNLVIRWVLQ